MICCIFCFPTVKQYKLKQLIVVITVSVSGDLLKMLWQIPQKMHLCRKTKTVCMLCVSQLSNLVKQERDSMTGASTMSNDIGQLCCMWINLMKEKEKKIEVYYASYTINLF